MYCDNIATSTPSRSGTERRAPIVRSDSESETKRQKRRRGWWRTRIGALTKVFGGSFRYGGAKLYQFTDDDAGREDLHILLDHYVFSNPLKIPGVIKARAPWLSDSERESLMEQVGRFPRYWTSAALAEALRLTEGERIALGGVPTIGAVDVSPEQRKEIRKKRDRERKRRKRRTNPRAAYLAANSISRDKPWEKENISRRTWYRRRGTSLSAVNLVKAVDIPVPTSERRLRAVPSRDAAGWPVKHVVRPPATQRGSALRIAA